MIKILIVEDCEDLGILLKKTLENSDYNVTYVGDIECAKQAMEEDKFEMIILDDNLPDGHGTELCFWIRKQSVLNLKSTVIMITSTSSLENKLRAFDFGVNDYVVKPFNPLEIKMRIKERVNTLNEAAKTIVMGGITFYPKNLKCGLLFIDKIRDIELTLVEYQLLFKFAKNYENDLSRESLLHSFGYSGESSSRTLDQHILKLRKKMKNSSLGIKSIYSFGYRLEAVA